MKIGLLLVALIIGVKAKESSFYHISDVHLDTEYDRFTASSSFCHNNQTLTAGGTFGRYGCDTPFALLESALNQMKMIEKQPSFILLTGDVVAHRTNGTQKMKIAAEFTKLFKSKFPNITLIPSLGNNDVNPEYQWTCEAGNVTKYYASLWKDFIGTGMEDFLKMGALSTSPLPGLRVLSLNTNLYSIGNKENYPDPVDPCGQLQWLKLQLQRATDNSERVFVAGHIPPGADIFSLKTFWKPDSL